MTKRLGGKLLSVILTIAICLSTVLGCLITANAADGVVPCYSWSDGAVTTDLEKATIKLTIDSSKVLSGGVYSALFDIVSDDLVIADLGDDIESISIVEGTRADGAAFDASDYDVSYVKGGTTVDINVKVDEDHGTADNFTKIVLEITLEFTTTVDKTATYPVTLKGLQMANGGDASDDSDYYNYTGEDVVYAIAPKCEHVIAVKGEPIRTDAVNGYAVYENSYCTICEEEFGYQLVPSTEPMNGKTITWNGSTEAMALTEPGTKEEPYIIQNAEQLAWLVSEATPAQTHQKHFRIADGIDNIVLQSSGAEEIMALDGVDNVKNYLSNKTAWKKNDASTSLFCGHFDGNGATVYGLYVVNGALFSYVGIGASVSNIAVENSYCLMNGGSKSSILVGGVLTYTHNGQTFANTSVYEGSKGEDLNDDGDQSDWISTAYENGYVAFDNVKITNCKIILQNAWFDRSNSVGILMGHGGSYTPVHISNLLVYGNEMEYTYTADNQNVKKFSGINNILIGFLDNDNPATDPHFGTAVAGCYIKNSLILDAQLVAQSNANNDLIALKTAYDSVYTNVTESGSLTITECKGTVYTNWITLTTSNVTSAGGLEVVDAGENNTNVLGANAVNTCPDLDWGTTWSYGADGEYPSIASTGRSIISWDNSKDTNLADEKHSYSTQDGSVDNPIIIDSVAELYYLTRAGRDATVDKYFKVADGIDAMVLQNVEYAQAIIDLEDAAQVKAYFSDESKISSPYQWYQKSWNSEQFAGYFDGNGVEIYGLCSNCESTAVAGLFPIVDSGAVIKNVALKNSYFNHTTGDNYDFGGLVGRGKSGKDTDAIISVVNCAVINNYLYKATNSSFHERTGILAGPIREDAIMIKNCLVYGNDATYYDSVNQVTYQMPMRCIGANQLTATQDFIEKYGEQYTHYNSVSGTCYRNMVVDTIALGCLPYNQHINGSGNRLGSYINVYTDQTLVDAPSGTAEQWAESGCVTKINTSEAIGKNAETIMDLEWGTEWYANINGYPTLAALEKTSVAKTSNSSMELIGSNMSYNDDGTLDFNFHYIPVEGYTPVFYVGKTNETGVTEFITLTEPTASSARAELGEDAMMFTIPRLAARDVNTTWVPTLVATNGAVTEWGMSQKLSLGQYAEAILSGNVAYETAEAKEKYELADKKVAAALLNYADAATLALGTENDVPASKNKVEYFTGIEKQPTKLDSSKENSESNPYIISNVENLYWLVKTGVGIDLNGDGINGNEYFKVADNVKALVLQKEDAVTAAGGFDALANLTVAEVKEWFDDPEKTYNYNTDGNPSLVKSFNYDRQINDNEVVWTKWSNNGDINHPFQGHFDANGATIYGMLVQGTDGLFASLNNATIQNLNIKASYVLGYRGGLIAGWSANDTTHNGVTTLKNCTASNSCVLSWRNPANGDAHKTVGVLLGNFGSQGIRVSNCAVYDNIAYNCAFDDGDAEYENDTYTGGNTLSFIGKVKDDSVAGKISNSVIMGVYPYSSTNDAKYDNGLLGQAQYSNVYTDMPTEDLSYTTSGKVSYNKSQIKQITPENIKGKNAATTLSLDFESDWMITKGYPQPVQSGYTATGGKTLYWDGGRTEPTEGKGTEENPIIINTASELAYVAYSGLEYTTNVSDNYSPKYFKIADGIEKIVLQPAAYANDIIALDSVTKVKDFFTNSENTGLLQWADKAFDLWNSGYFGGHFNGNGVEIYGMYGNVSNKYLSLFPNVDGSASIENVSVMNSYMKSTNTDNSRYRAAAFVANVGSSTYGTKSDGWTVSINNCKVANSYFSAPQDAKDDVGVLVAAGTYAHLKVNNCIVYGNEAYYNNKSSETAGSLIGDVWNVNGSGLSNSIILDTMPDVGIDTCTDTYFSNVYTDQTTTYSTVTTVDDLSKLKGTAAADIVDKFNTSNGKTVWYTGTADDYPGFEEADTMPNWLQAKYDSFDFGAFNNYSEGKIVSVDGSSEIRLRTAGFNFGANPYMSFVFSIKGEYLTNRDKISITFKADGLEHTVTVPEYNAEGIDGQWINRANSANHTYQFDSIPVSAFIKEIEVWASYEGGDAVKLGTVSAEGLATSFINANKKTPCNYYANTAEAAKAVYFYALMVNERITL